MERLIVFVVCSLLCIVSVKPWPVKDSDKPAIHQILEGKDLKVVCNATEEIETGIYWWKNDTKAPFREEGNTLSFQNIRRNATGEYICYSENVTVVEVIKVDVLYPAEITEFYIDKTVIKGDEPLNVHCKFEGNPDPNFIIMNNNSRYQHVYVDATGSHMDITNVIPIARCEDSGPWVCTGRNSLNKRNVTRSGNVTVFCGPHPNYDQMETKYKVKTMLGQTAYLVMNNFGNPHPKYTWSHNGEIIASDKHVDLGFASVLNISNVREEDFGTYTLLMENTYGQYRSKYELLPPVKDTDKPAIHQILEGKDLKVVCNATEEIETGIYWWKNDTKAPFREEGNTLSFQNIRRNATGEYICYSENVTVVEVIKVDVLYPAEITEFSIDKTVIKGDEPLNVHCKFEGNPDPNFIIMNNNSRYQHVYVDATGSHMDITNVIPIARCEDSGPWVCTGRNSLNKRNVTRSGNVTVFCGPHPNYDQMETKYKVKTMLGQTAYLVMNNFGNPHPKYTWSHNGEIIASDKHVDLGFASVLNISNVREEDFGTYTLLMENTYGQYRSKYELLPPGPPQRPMDLRYYDLTHDSVHLEWFAGFDMGSIQHFLVLRVYDGVTVVYSEKIFDTSRGGLYDYTVTDLTPATIYRFVISADNGFVEPVLSYNSVEFETLDAPTTTTTATTTMTLYWFRLSDTTWGIILISFSGALIFIALFVGLVFIMYKGKYRNAKTPYKAMPRKSRQIQKAPLQLSVDNLDMRKVAL